LRRGKKARGYMMEREEKYEGEEIWTGEKRTGGKGREEE